MDEEEQFISSIYNYCDRWCERCEFTTRCRVFADERSQMLEDSDDPMGDAIRVVAESLAETKQMLMDHADEMGIDLEASANDPEIAESIERSRSTVDNEESVILAKKYAFDIRPVLESRDEWLTADAKDDPTTGDMIAILYWYQFFIAAKVHRAFHSILDFDGYEDTDELSDPQSDANGSAKVALIAVERSIRAWTYLLNPNNAAVIRPFIELL